MFLWTKTEVAVLGAIFIAVATAWGWAVWVGAPMLWHHIHTGAL